MRRLRPDRARIDSRDFLKTFPHATRSGPPEAVISRRLPHRIAKSHSFEFLCNIVQCYGSGYCKPSVIHPYSSHGRPLETTESQPSLAPQVTVVAAGHATLAIGFGKIGTMQAQ